MSGTDIVAFLTARLDEDQAVAEAAHGEVWTKIGSGADIGPAIGRTLFHRRFGPPRVLREVAAKRRVLARHSPRDLDWLAAQRRWHDKYRSGLPFEPKPPPCAGCGSSSLRGPRGTFKSFARRSDFTTCPELRDMAAIYADHADYQEGWKP